MIQMEWEYAWGQLYHKTDSSVEENPYVHWNKFDFYIASLK